MKTYHILLLLAVMTVFSCSQKATVEVENLSGATLSGTIDGQYYSIDPGETASEEIEIGRKFIFGTDEKTITVTGEGWCVLRFSQRETVKNEDVVSLSVDSDAGVITVENYTPYSADVYIESCSGLAWGSGTVYSYYSSSWSVPVGCYYIEIWVGGYFYLSDSDYLEPCTEITYSLYTTQSGRLSVSKRQGDEEKVDLSGSIGAPTRTMSERLKAASPEKRLCEIIASSRGVPKSAE